MLELTELLNNPNTGNDMQLFNIAALLSSDEAYIYTPTYLTDSQDGLKNFKTNTIELNKLLVNYTELLNEKLSAIIDEEDLVWAFKLQANNSVEILSDDITSIVVREKFEDQLLKLLSSSNITSFILSLHFKYSKNELIGFDYNGSFRFHIQHSFKVNNKRDIRNSIFRFVKIVKLHLHAE